MPKRSFTQRFHHWAQCTMALITSESVSSYPSANHYRDLREVSPSKAACDDKAAESLWEESCKLLDIHPQWTNQLTNNNDKVQ